MVRPLSLRFAFALLVAVQILLPTAADLADARVIATSQSGWDVVHIESERSADCPRGHPDDCALCRFATHLADAPRAHALAQLPGNEKRFALADVPGPVTSDSHRLPSSRAPPLS
jgi:hypothetical protein